MIHEVFTVTNSLKSVTARSCYCAITDLIHEVFAVTNNLKSRSRLHYAVSNMSGCRYVSDCRSSSRKFDPSLVSYFHGIDQEIIPMVILLPSADSRMVVVC